MKKKKEVTCLLCANRGQCEQRKVFALPRGASLMDEILNLSTRLDMKIRALCIIPGVQFGTNIHYALIRSQLTFCDSLRHFWGLVSVAR